MKNHTKLYTTVFLMTALILAGTATAQTTPHRSGPLNPPPLPEARTERSGPAPAVPSNFAAPNNSIWIALGPAPLNSGGSISGRIAGVAVDPTNVNNIYIAAAGGGVWQSTDGGSTYLPLTDTQGTEAMGAIAIAPSNRLKIYAGTGEANNSADSNFGLGILVSNDAGATWSLSTGPGGVFNRQAIAKISVHPTDQNTAYAAVADFAENGICCSNTGIYKTFDGGTTWMNVTSAAGKDSLYPWTDVVVDPNSPTIIYAAHGDIYNNNSTNGVYRSIAEPPGRFCPMLLMVELRLAESRWLLRLRHPPPINTCFTSPSRLRLPPAAAVCTRCCGPTMLTPPLPCSPT